MAVCLNISRLGAVAAGGKMIPSGSLSFCEKDFGWMDVWELNPEGMISLLLKAVATLRGDHFG
jgi:hypothetical protein